MKISVHILLACVVILIGSRGHARASTEADLLQAMMFEILLPKKHSKFSKPGRTRSLFADYNAPTESDRRLYIASQTERSGLTLMEADLREFQNFAAIESLVARLNEQSRTRQSFFHVERMGNRAHLSFFVNLSHDDTQTIQAVNREGLLQLQNERMAGAAAAQLFHPARALYVEMGPEVEEMELDERFGRAYKLIDNRAAVRGYSESFDGCEARLRLREVSEIGG